ncbi:MAG: hypothetical protein HY903_19435 [Deltaproteobacteria bacterium]|nr:hypothetical protein [Deltaproteobacteria bacterium]
MTTISSFDDLRARVTTLAAANKLSDATLLGALREAKQAKVELSSAELKAIHDVIESTPAAATLKLAPTLLKTMLPALKAPDGGVSVSKVALQIAAGRDGVLQGTEIKDALDAVQGYYVAKGLAPDAALLQARRTILGELGVGVGGTTIHKLDQGQVTQLAKAFGSPLASHSANYAFYVQSRVLNETTTVLAEHLASRPDVTAADLALVGHAESFAALATALANAGLLDDGVAALAQTMSEPYRAAFVAVVAKADAANSADRLAVLKDGIAALDKMKVVVVDSDKNKQLNGGDLVTMKLGEVVVLQAVDPTLADQLIFAKASQQAAADLVGAKGRSKFAFQVGKPTANAELFELRDHSYKLKSGKSASAAIKDMLAHPEKYKFECATGIAVFWKVAEYRYYQAKFGPDADRRFDARFAGMEIGTIVDQGGEWVGDEDGAKERLDTWSKQFGAMPGDYRYFYNAAVSLKGEAMGWSGENVIDLGKARRDGPGYKRGDHLYYGHPFGITTEKSILACLNSHRFEVEVESAPQLDAALNAIDLALGPTPAGAGAPASPPIDAASKSKLEAIKVELKAIRARIDASVQKRKDTLQNAHDGGTRESTLNLDAERERYDHETRELLEALLAGVHGQVAAIHMAGTTTKNGAYLGLLHDVTQALTAVRPIGAALVVGENGSTRRLPGR